jgi:2-(1,2-epoxy-1,2-dihydrophenyl)acetyl-CoA isomerase
VNKYLLTNRLEHVLTVSLNRADAQNALIPELLTELAELFEGLRDDAETHAVVLQSDSTAFSLGGDMHGFKRRFPDIRTYAARIVGELNRAMLAMIAAPQPIVTAVHGAVTGGSMGLVLASDLVLASPQAVFKAHYASAGFSPDGGWTALLPRLIGIRRAAECLLLNRSFDAQRAAEWGVINAVVESEKLREEAQRVARKVAGYPSGTMRNSKRLLWREREQIAAELEQELEKFVEQITRDGAQEDVERFLQTFRDYPAENL